MPRAEQSVISMGPAPQRRSAFEMTISIRSFRPQASALRWLILIMLLWAQFAYSGHQLVHSVDEPGSTCQICIGCDRLDDAMSEPACSNPVPSALSAAPSGFTLLEYAERPRYYGARASPQIPDSSI